jgi:hypothetical protein
MKTRLSQFFQDDTGALSAMRLMFITWGLGVLILWTILSVMARQMLPIPAGVVEILGMCVGGKVIQAFSENATTITSNQPIVPTQQVIQQQPPAPMVLQQAPNMPPGFQMAPPPQ